MQAVGAGGGRGQEGALDQVKNSLQPVPEGPMSLQSADMEWGLGMGGCLGLSMGCGDLKKGA